MIMIKAMNSKEVCKLFRRITSHDIKCRIKAEKNVIDGTTFDVIISCEIEEISRDNSNQTITIFIDDNEHCTYLKTELKNIYTVTIV